MTYLEAVNSVLKRLRESSVAAVDDTTYSAMIGELVNDAMHVVQNAWNWSELMSEIDVSTAASTQTVTVDGIGEGGQIYHILNDTSNYKLHSAASGWMKIQTSISGASEGPPRYYSSNSVETDGDLTLDLYPIPDAVYTLKVFASTKQADLSADGDVIKVPAQPVVQQAFAYALDERGDSGGNNNMMQQAKADRYLADYIGLDQQRHPELLLWATQ